MPLFFLHWLGFEAIIAFAGLLGFSVLVMFSVKRHIPADPVLIFSMFIITAFILINLAFNIDDKNEYFFKYFLHYLSFFCVLVLVIFLKQRFDALVFIAKLIFWIAFLTIFLESFAVNIAGVSKDYFPAVRFAPSYYGDYMGLHRPFGLTGQSSVNGCILLLSFLLLTELHIKNRIYSIMLVLGVLLTISGQAILSTFFILVLLQVRKFKSIMYQIGFLLMGLGLIYSILQLNIVEKVSYDYLIYVLIEKAHIASINLLDPFQLMFGAMGTISVGGDESTEVFFIESVIRYGIVFTILYWLFLWVLVRRTSQPMIWFIASFLSSVHYPTLFYIEAQIILGLVFMCARGNGRGSSQFNHSSGNIKFS
jgi:hypothetical protein